MIINLPSAADTIYGVSLEGAVLFLVLLFLISVHNIKLLSLSYKDGCQNSQILL